MAYWVSNIWRNQKNQRLAARFRESILKRWRLQRKDSEVVPGMKRITLSLLAWAALTLPAHAQNFLDLPSWQHWNLNSMTTDEEARIHAGIRNGSLTRDEASRLLNRVAKINSLKAQLARGGLNMSERIRLDREIDKLAESIYRETSYNNRSRWLGNKPFDWARNWRNDYSCDNLSSWQHWNLNNLTGDEQARINQGLRNGSLTRAEATKLQARLNQINNLKSTLMVGGLSMRERQRLDAELDALSEAIFRESNNNQRARWLGRNPYTWANSWNNNSYRPALNQAKRDWDNNRRDESGQLSNKQVRKIGKNYDQYQKKSDKWNDNNGLTSKQQRKLDKKADKIERKMR